MIEEKTTAQPKSHCTREDPLSRLAVYMTSAKRRFLDLGWRLGLVEKPVRPPADFCDKPESALMAYRLFNDGMTDAEENFAPELIERAVQFAYLAWPKRIRQHIAGKDVLDVGCGTGLHGIGFAVIGVKSYTGVDPRVDPDQRKSKNLRTRKWEDFGWTGRQIMTAMPRIRLISGGIEDLPSVEHFDVIVLHNVTEHLMELESVIEEVSRRLKPKGILLYNHHNFFAWNGHHMAPKKVSEIDSSDPEQKHYVDWAHLDFDPPEGHYFQRGLNRIRLHELWELTEKYFDVLEWTCKASSSEQGADRLTDGIRARYPELDDEDFLTQNVFVRASPRPAERVLVALESTRASDPPAEYRGLRS